MKIFNILFSLSQPRIMMNVSRIWNFLLCGSNLLHFTLKWISNVSFLLNSDVVYGSITVKNSSCVSGYLLVCTNDLGFRWLVG